MSSCQNEQFDYPGRDEDLKRQLNETKSGTYDVNSNSKIVTKTTEVYCTTQMAGIHNWPGCPFDEVSYLRDPHRHMFHIKAHKLVTHSDRDVEFIMLKHLIEEYLNMEYWHDQHKCLYFGAMSCEMIAEELINKFDLCRCEVSEDGENGAIITVEDV